MPSFTGQAIEPDVYFRISDVVVPNVPAGVFIPVIIGLGSKTLQITETLTRGATPGGEDGPLSNLPIVTIDTIVDYVGTTYIETTDYVVTANKIDWTPAGAEPTAGTEYFVTYTYSKPSSAYDAQLFSRSQDVITFYGPARIQSILDSGTATSGTSTTLEDTTKTWTVDTYIGQYVKITTGTGVGQIRTILSNTADTLTVVDSWDTDPDATSVYQINDISENSISLASQILFENTNGNGYVYCVQSKEDTSTEFQNAIDRIRDKEGAYCLVVMKGMTTGDPLITYLKTHVDNQSATLGKHERIALIGAPVNQTSYSVFSTTASGIADSRLCYIAPAEGKREIDGVVYSFDGSYIAAAISGIITNPTFDAGEPIGGKSLTGFTNIPDPFLLSEKRNMLGNGVMIIETRQGIPRILQALSTDISSVVDAEIKITRIKDYIIDLLRQNLRGSYLNTRNIGPESLSSIKAFIQFLLDSTITQRILVAYQDLQVLASTADPRQVDVSFKIKPVWDIEYIFVTFGVTFP